MAVAFQVFILVLGQNSDWNLYKFHLDVAMHLHHS